MARVIQTKRRLVATYTLGSGLTANVPVKIKELADVQPFIDVGRKSMLARVVCKVTASFTIPSSSPALPTLFLKYLLDKSMVGPGNYDVAKDLRGWHDPIWAYMQRGEIDGIRGADIAANTTSATRTWTQAIDFEEPLSSSPLARMYPIEAFRAPNAGLWLTLRSGITIKGVALTVSAATVKVFVDVFDVDAGAVPLPIPVSTFALQTNNGDLTPSPGPGKYLRIVMANSPVVGDNLDSSFGTGTTPTSCEDLSAITHIDSFGYAANYVVQDEDVDLLMQRVMRDVTVERHSQLSSNAGNKSEFRLLDPQENFDSLTRAIPLVYPSKGTDITSTPSFEAPPKLAINGGVRTGLPAGFQWLCQRFDARSDTMLNALVGALSSSGTGKSILGRSAIVAPGYVGRDYSRSPLLINAK